MTPPRVLIIGAGMVAARLLEELAALGLPGSAITAAGEEPAVFYDRIALSKVAAGAADADAIALIDRATLAQRGVTVIAGDPVVAVDATAKAVRTASGRKIGYDALVFATGADAIRPPIPGADLPETVAYRNLADARRMAALAQPGRRAIVVGGGLLGLEAAAALAQRGAQTDILHLTPWVMERQLDRDSAELVQAAMAARGVRVRTEMRIASVLADAKGAVAGVRLEDGHDLPADMVVFAMGARPRIDLARAAGLICERGVMVDDDMRASLPDIYAVGDCAQHRGRLYGLVAPAYGQAKACAAALLGRPAPFAPVETPTRLKVAGLDVYSAGDVLDGPGREIAFYRDRVNGRLRRLVIRNDRLIGCVLVGRIDDGPWYADLIQSGAPLGALRSGLMFGRAAAQAAQAA